MKQFSFNRFWQLLLSYLADNKKRLMILGGGLFAATIVLFTVGMLAGSTATVGKANVIGIDMKVMRLITAIGYANNVAGIATMVILSRVFANMEQRSGEIQFLMLPATTMEKWLSRVAYIVLVGWLMPVVATYAGILTWTGVASLLGFEDGATLLRIMFDNAYALDMMHISYPGSLVFLTFAFAIFEVAYFIYCGTVFRHNAWLKTAVTNGSTQAGSAQDVMELVSLTRHSALFLWSGIGTLALAPLFFVLSYRSFRKRQLETRKYNIITLQK